MIPKEASELLAILTAHYPNSKVPPETLGLWKNKLLAIDLNDAVAALDDTTSSGKFFPAWSEFKAAATRSAARRGEQRRSQALLTDGGNLAPAGYMTRANELFPKIAAKEMTGEQVMDILHAEFNLCTDDCGLHYKTKPHWSDR